MLSYFNNRECAWTRRPFVTLDEIADQFHLLVRSSGLFSNIQINSEDFLDGKINFSKENEQEKDILTIREIIYGNYYQELRKYIEDKDILPYFRASMNSR